MDQDDGFRCGTQKLDLQKDKLPTATQSLLKS